jgi:DNA-binding NarL/FixJ family response regulator
VYAALQTGASGFLLKDVEPDELRRAVRVVAAGDALLAPAVTRRLIATFASGPAVPGTETLTAREREVVALVATGLSDAEIGLRLTISPATAKTHANRAMAKLGARDRAQLVDSSCLGKKIKNQGLSGDQCARWRSMRSGGWPRFGVSSTPV